MFQAAKKELIGGKKTFSKEIKLLLTESIIAKDFSSLQKKYSEVTMGSYPFDGGTSLVFRSTENDLLEQAVSEMLAKIDPSSVIKIS